MPLRLRLDWSLTKMRSPLLSIKSRPLLRRTGFILPEIANFDHDRPYPNPAASARTQRRPSTQTRPTVLRFRHLGKDVVALGRKPVCGLDNIVLRQGEPDAVDQAVIEIEQRSHQHGRIECVVSPACIINRSSIGLGHARKSGATPQATATAACVPWQ